MKAVNWLRKIFGWKPAQGGILKEGNLLGLKGCDLTVPWRANFTGAPKKPKFPEGIVVNSFPANKEAIIPLEELPEDFFVKLEPDFIIVSKSELSDDQFAAIKAIWENQYKSTKQAHRVVVLEEGIQE